jgi:hypothetical protein
VASGWNQGAGCVVWCGLVTGGAAAGVLLALAAELIWPTQVADGGPLAGAGVLGLVLGRAALAGLVGAIVGGAAAGWAVGRLRRGSSDRAEPSAAADRGRR